MPKCNVCKTIYNEPQKQMMIRNNVYWCALCCQLYKVFNPIPASYFAPELDVAVVLARQQEHYASGKSTGWYRN